MDRQPECVFSLLTWSVSFNMETWWSCRDASWDDTLCVGLASFNYMLCSGYSHSRCYRLNNLTYVLVVVALSSLCTNRSQRQIFFCKTDSCNVIECVRFLTVQTQWTKLFKALVCSDYRTVRITGFQIKNLNFVVKLFIRNCIGIFYV
jgi:hypothetical protein